MCWGRQCLVMDCVMRVPFLRASSHLVHCAVVALCKAQNSCESALWRAWWTCSPPAEAPDRKPATTATTATTRVRMLLHPAASRTCLSFSKSSSTPRALPDGCRYVACPMPHVPRPRPTLTCAWMCVCVCVALQQASPARDSAQAQLASAQRRIQELSDELNIAKRTAVRPPMSPPDPRLSFLA